MDRTYRAILLLHRHRCDGGVASLGHAMSEEEWWNILDTVHEPDRRLHLDQAINAYTMQNLRRMPTPQKITRLILEVAAQ